MHAAPFDSPVHVVFSGKTVTKLHCAKEGFDFLLTCPIQEGPIFESALEACFSALSNPELSADARRGLATFAHVHGLLAEVGSSPHTAARKLRIAWRNEGIRRHSASSHASR